MTLYLLDANVLIRAHEDYYPIDRIPPFWDWLLDEAARGRVKLPPQIYKEVAPYRGLLPQWLKQPHVREALVLTEPTHAATVQQVLTHGYAPDLTDVEIEDRAGPVPDRGRVERPRPDHCHARRLEAEGHARQPAHTRCVCHVRCCRNQRLRAVPAAGLLHQIARRDGAQDLFVGDTKGLRMVAYCHSCGTST